MKNNTKEVKEFAKICEDTINKKEAKNLLEFLAHENGKSANMLIWALTVSLSFLMNQTQDKWVFDEPTEEEAEIAQVIITKTIKSINNYLNPNKEHKLKLEF